MKSVAEMFPEEKEDSELIKEFQRQAQQIFVSARFHLTLQGKVPRKYAFPDVDIDEFLKCPDQFPNTQLCSIGFCAAVGTAMGVKGWKAIDPRASGGPIGFVICALDDAAKACYREGIKPDYHVDEKDIERSVGITMFNDHAEWDMLLYVWDRCGKENGWL